MVAIRQVDLYRSLSCWKQPGSSCILLSVTLTKCPSITTATAVPEDCFVPVRGLYDPIRFISPTSSSSAAPQRGIECTFCSVVCRLHSTGNCTGQEWNTQHPLRALHSPMPHISETKLLLPKAVISINFRRRANSLRVLGCGNDQVRRSFVVVFLVFG